MKIAPSYNFIYPSRRQCGRVTKARRTRNPAVPVSSPTLALTGRFVTKSFRYKSPTTGRKKILEGFPKISTTYTQSMKRLSFYYDGNLLSSAAKRKMFCSKSTDNFICSETTLQLRCESTCSETTGHHPEHLLDLLMVVPSSNPRPLL